MEFIIEEINLRLTAIALMKKCIPNLSSRLLAQPLITTKAQTLMNHILFMTSTEWKKSTVYRIKQNNKKYIHWNNNEINNKYFNRKQPIFELFNSKFNSLYKNGKYT